MSYLLYQQDKIVGVFDDLQKAKDMAQGIIDNGWAKNFSIVQYKINSCCKVKEIKVDNDDDDDETVTTYENDSEIIKEDDKNNKELQSKLNLLNLQKEKIEESKTKFEIDLKLYNEFKEKLETDNNFNIPELFVEKYKIFHQLEQEDNISWDSFALLYKEADFFGNYSNIFEVNNSFETKFLQDIDTDTESSEELKSTEGSEHSSEIIEIIQVVNSSDEDDSSSD